MLGTGGKESSSELSARLAFLRRVGELCSCVGDNERVRASRRDCLRGFGFGVAWGKGAGCCGGENALGVRLRFELAAEGAGGEAWKVLSEPREKGGSSEARRTASWFFARQLDEMVGGMGRGNVRRGGRACVACPLGAG